MSRLFKVMRLCWIIENVIFVPNMQVCEQIFSFKKKNETFNVDHKVHFDPKKRGPHVHKIDFLSPASEGVPILVWPAYPGALKPAVVLETRHISENDTSRFDIFL